jgi:hypothetical protein
MKRICFRCKRAFDFSERLMGTKIGAARYVCPACSIAACEDVLSRRVAK